MSNFTRFAEEIHNEPTKMCDNSNIQNPRRYLQTILQQIS